jgi:hypothetical protein
MAILLRHVNEAPPAPRTVDPSIDPELAKWLEWMLAKSPDDRPQSAQDAWDALEEIVIEQAGPRWRRAARILDRQPQAETPKPLTPAPFSGELPTGERPETVGGPLGPETPFPSAVPTSPPPAATPPPPVTPAPEPAATPPPPQPAAPATPDPMAAPVPPKEEGFETFARGSGGDAAPSAPAPPAARAPAPPEPP